MKENLNCESLQCIYHIQDISSCRYMLKNQSRIQYESDRKMSYKLVRFETNISNSHKPKSLNK